MNKIRKAAWTLQYSIYPVWAQGISWLEEERRKDQWCFGYKKKYSHNSLWKYPPKRVWC